MRYLSASAQQRYSSAFDVLLPYFAQIVASRSLRFRQSRSQVCEQRRLAAIDFRATFGVPGATGRSAMKPIDRRTFAAKVGIVGLLLVDARFGAVAYDVASDTALLCTTGDDVLTNTSF
jgi:hypothetical protein